MRSHFAFTRDKKHNKRTDRDPCFFVVSPIVSSYNTEAYNGCTPYKRNALFFIRKNVEMETRDGRSNYLSSPYCFCYQKRTILVYITSGYPSRSEPGGCY